MKLVLVFLTLLYTVVGYCAPPDRITFRIQELEFEGKRYNIIIANVNMIDIDSNPWDIDRHIVQTSLYDYVFDALQTAILEGYFRRDFERDPNQRAEIDWKVVSAVLDYPESEHIKELEAWETSQRVYQRMLEKETDPIKRERLRSWLEHEPRFVFSAKADLYTTKNSTIIIGTELNDLSKVLFSVKYIENNDVVDQFGIKHTVGEIQQLYNAGGGIDFTRFLLDYAVDNDILRIRSSNSQERPKRWKPPEYVRVVTGPRRMFLYIALGFEIVEMRKVGDFQEFVLRQKTRHLYGNVKAFLKGDIRYDKRLSKDQKRQLKLTLAHYQKLRKFTPRVLRDFDLGEEIGDLTRADDSVPEKVKPGWIVYKEALWSPDQQRFTLNMQANFGECGGITDAEHGGRPFYHPGDR